MRRKTMIEERFWEKVIVASPSECWEWQAARDPKGYGRLHRKNGSQLAHRMAYELTHGPIPDDKLVLHSCDNPPCCSPFHLRIGTHADNTQDAIDRNRIVSLCGSANPQSILTEEDVARIRVAARNGVTYSQLARFYKVHVNTLRSAAVGISWKHIDEKVCSEFRKGLPGDKSPHHRLTNEKVRFIRQQLRENSTTTDSLAQKFNVDVSTIRYAATGGTWKTCDEPPVVLTHAFTHPDVRRKAVAQRKKNGSYKPQNVGNTKLKDSQVIEMRARWKNRGKKPITQTQMATEYNVSISLINNVVNRKVWRHI